MASFIEGLAKGLQNQEEMQLRRNADRRQEAISLATLASQADDLEYKRQERKRESDLRAGMSNLYNSIYNPEVEEQVPVQSGAIQDPSAPAQTTTQKVRKSFTMGERSTEGRARDMQYMMGYTKLMIDSGKITPEQMKQSMEFNRYLETEGLKDSLATLILKPEDKNAAGVLAKRFNLDPASVNFEVVNKDAQGKPTAVPRFVLTAKNANGMPVQYDVSNALQAIGVSTLADIQKGNVGLAKDNAAINASNAAAGASNAASALHTAQAAEVAPNAKSQRELRDSQVQLNRDRGAALQEPKTNTSLKFFSTKTGIDGKPVEMPYGRTLHTQLSNYARSKGLSGNSAEKWATEAMGRFQRGVAGQITGDKAASASMYNDTEQKLMMDAINGYIKADGGAAELKPAADKSAAARKSAMDTTNDVTE